MYWDIARHPGDVTENGIAAFDDVVSHRGETGLDHSARLCTIFAYLLTYYNV